MAMSMSGPVDPGLIRELATPDLALRLLAAVGGDVQLNANSVLRGAEAAFKGNGEPDLDFLLGRLSDAWAWLEAQALVGPSVRDTASTWQRLTREGQKAAAAADALPALWAARRLAGDLHPMLEEKVRPIFNLGDYETACFAAMKAVEVEVRRASALDGSVLGVDLMRQAFRDGGPLADPEAHAGEQRSTMELFAGAIGAFKNPASHRTVDFADPVEAVEVVQLADLLLRLLARAERRRLDASVERAEPK